MLPSDGGGSSPLKPEKKYVSTPSPLRTPSHASHSSANAAEYRMRSTPQPPAPPKRKDNDWSAADERAAQHKAIAAREHSKKPTPPPHYSGSANAAEHRLPKPKPESSKPRVYPTNFIGPVAPGARRAAPSNPAPGTRPKPAFGTAGDLAAATQSRQQAVRNLEAAKSLPANLNRGGIKQMEIQDAQRSLSAADARQKSARAEKGLEAAKSLPPSLNRGGVKQMEIRDAQQAASSARTAYLGSQGLDSSGKPIVVTPPKPPAPDKPKEKHWWEKATDFVKDHAEDIGHGALDAAGFIPVVGAAADLANAGWYLAEGDKTNAALSAVAAIPGVGDAVAATAIAGKVAVKGAKAVKVAAKAAEKADDTARWSRSALKVEKTAPSTSKTYITYTFKDSKGNVRYVGRASGKGTPDEVLAQRISKGHRIAKNHPELTARVEGLPGAIGVQGSRSANKGAEDVLYSYHQTRGDKIVNGQTVTGGASRGNQPLLNRTNPLSNIKRKIEATGRRHIENYARDLKGATPI
jgi:hypothetical protein